MIACPFCMAETAVVETRRSANGVRRRRKCAVCGRCVTTFETIIPSVQGQSLGDMVLVSRVNLDKLRSILDAAYPAPPARKAVTTTDQSMASEEQGRLPALKGD